MQCMPSIYIARTSSGDGDTIDLGLYHPPWDNRLRALGWWCKAVVEIVRCATLLPLPNIQLQALLEKAEACLGYVSRKRIFGGAFEANLTSIRNHPHEWSAKDVGDGCYGLSPT
jgi:hypothetical protein